MSGLSRLAFGLVALLTASVLIADFALLPSMAQEKEHPSIEEGCYCHNQGISLYVNDTPFMSDYGSGLPGLAQPILVGRGSRFTLVVSAEQHALDTSPRVIEPVMAWYPTPSTDNAKFTFDPEEVRDNSPEDRDPRDGNIVALFRMVAPDEDGSYVLSLSTHGKILRFPIRVRPQTVTSPSETLTARSETQTATKAVTTSIATFSALDNLQVMVTMFGLVAMGLVGLLLVMRFRSRRKMPLDP